MSRQELRDRRHAIESVRDVVSAMRATAAGRIQAAQRALATTRRYRDVVLRGLAAAGVGDVIPSREGHSGLVLLVVLTSEQPLCGGFNHPVVEMAVSEYRTISADLGVELVAVGHRGGRAIAARGLTPDHLEPGATSLPGLRELVQRLAHRVDHGYATGRYAAVRVVYSRYRSVSEQIPTVEPVLPVVPPVTLATHVHRYLPDPDLVAGLLGQFAYISLYHAAAESYASEQASRLVAMDGATRNTGRMVDDLTAIERRARQDEITRQMMELAAGRFVEGGN